MDPDTSTLELQGLTDIEEMLIARGCPIMCVYRKHGGQRGYRGHVLNLLSLSISHNLKASRGSAIHVFLVYQAYLREGYTFAT